jgi:hypothetical protein
VAQAVAGVVQLAQLLVDVGRDVAVGMEALPAEVLVDACHHACAAPTAALREGVRQAEDVRVVVEGLVHANRVGAGFGIHAGGTGHQCRRLQRAK